MNTIRRSDRSWLHIVSGGAVGFLVAVGWLYGHLPGPDAAYSNAVLGIGTLIGAAVAAFRWGRWFGYAAIVIAIIEAPVVSTDLVLRATNAWIRRDSIPPTPLDAVVVLSGAIDDDGLLNAPALIRLVSGVELMHRTHTPLLITTRVAHPNGRGGIATSDADQRALISVGIDTAAWRIASPTSNTHDEAVRTATLLAPASSHRIAVVTSPMHSRRACAVFEAVGFTVVCAPTEEREYDLVYQAGIYDRVRAMSEYGYERAAMVKYRMAGWIR